MVQLTLLFGRPVPRLNGRRWRDRLWTSQKPCSHRLWRNSYRWSWYYWSEQFESPIPVPARTHQEAKGTCEQYSDNRLLNIWNQADDRPTRLRKRPRRSSILASSSKPITQTSKTSNSTSSFFKASGLFSMRSTIWMRGGMWTRCAWPQTYRWLKAERLDSTGRFRSSRKYTWRPHPLVMAAYDNRAQPSATIAIQNRCRRVSPSVLSGVLQVNPSTV